MKIAHTVIFGGTKGMGRVLATSLTSQGQRVTILGRSCTDTPPFDTNTGHLACDLSDETSVQSAIERIKADAHRPRYLVFFQRFRGSENHWQGEINTTLTAFKTIVESLGDSFAIGADCGIVVVSSLAGKFIAPDQPLAYHVAKAAVLQMVQFFAVNLGPRGIRVNAVSPGATIKPESADYYAKNLPLRDLYGKLCPLGRMGRAEDVTNVIEFLCSPFAAFVNGQNIVVDGGISIQSHESLARRVTGI